MFSRFVLLIAIMFSVSPTIATAKDELSTLPLARFFSHFDKYLELPEGDKQVIGFIYYVKAQQDNVENVQLSFTHDGQEYNFTPKSNGLVTFRPTQAMLHANPTLKTNQPKGSLSLNLSFAANLPLEKELQMKTVHDITHKAWELMKSVSGAGFFAPKHTKLNVNFDRSCEKPVWTVRKGNNFEKEFEGDENINLGKKRIRNADTISFNCLPKVFILGGK